MQEAVHAVCAANPVHLLIAAAAVGDWQAAEPAVAKVSTRSKQPYRVELKPTPKIIDGIKAAFPQTRLVAFRAQSGLTAQELYDDAFSRLQKAGAEMIVANDVSQPGVGFETTTNAVTVIHASGEKRDLPLDDKPGIAIGILQEICAVS